jgi:hypothetical protein
VTGSPRASRQRCCPCAVSRLESLSPVGSFGPQGVDVGEVAVGPSVVYTVPHDEASGTSKPTYLTSKSTSLREGFERSVQIYKEAGLRASRVRLR